jgi:DNA-binding NtrC family response regulator
MSTPIVNDLYRALLATDARGSANRVVRLCMTYTRASAAALFEVRSGGKLALFTAVDAAQPLLDAAARAFEGDGLSKGTVTQGRHVVALVPGTSRPAVLALEAPKNPKAIGEALSVMGPVLVGAIEAARQVATEPTGTALRELLEANEWNVARVARILGVTRVTVYERMRARGIERLKVVRS